jgi:hypothetical protein
MIPVVSLEPNLLERPSSAKARISARKTGDEGKRDHHRFGKTWMDGINEGKAVTVAL